MMEKSLPLSCSQWNRFLGVLWPRQLTYPSLMMFFWFHCTLDVYCWIQFPKLLLRIFCFCVHQFSCSVVSDSLWPHDSQHTRPPCPSPAPGVYSNSCPWCHPTISSSVDPFSSCLQSFAASGSFLMSQLFTSDGQSIEVSASAICCKHFKYS